MKHTNPAVEMAAMASSARSCAPGLVMRPFAAFPGANQAMSATERNETKRNATKGTRVDALARRQRPTT